MKISRIHIPWPDDLSCYGALRPQDDNYLLKEKGFFDFEKVLTPAGAGTPEKFCYQSDHGNDVGHFNPCESG